MARFNLITARTKEPHRNRENLYLFDRLGNPIDLLKSPKGRISKDVIINPEDAVVTSAGAVVLLTPTLAMPGVGDIAVQGIVAHTVGDKPPCAIGFLTFLGDEPASDEGFDTNDWQSGLGGAWNASTDLVAYFNTENYALIPTFSIALGVVLNDDVVPVANGNVNYLTGAQIRFVGLGLQTTDFILEELEQATLQSALDATFGENVVLITSFLNTAPVVEEPTANGVFDWAVEFSGSDSETLSDPDNSDFRFAQVVVGAEGESQNSVKGSEAPTEPFVIDKVSMIWDTISINSIL